MAVLDCVYAISHGTTGTDTFRGVIVDNDYIFAVGIAPHNGAGLSDAFVVKLNKSDLTVVSTRLLGGADVDHFRDVCADSDYIYVVGTTSSEVSNFAVILVKIRKSDLAIMLNKKIESPNSDYGHGVCQDTNFVYVALWSTSFVDGGGARVGMVFKLNKADLSVVARRYYRLFNAWLDWDTVEFEELCADADNLYAVGNRAQEGPGAGVWNFHDALIVKYKKSDLSVLAEKALSGANRREYFYGCCVDGNHVYAVGRTTSAGPGAYSALIVKYNKADLSVAAQKVYGGPNNDYFENVWEDGSYVYAVGYTHSEGLGSYDALIVKFNKADLSIAARQVFGGSLGDTLFHNVYLDSSHIFTVGMTTAVGAGGADALVVKFKKALTIIGDSWPPGLTLADSALTLADSGLVLSDLAYQKADSSLAVDNSTLVEQIPLPLTRTLYSICVAIPEAPIYKNRAHALSREEL